MTAVDPQELPTPDEVCALLKMKRTWFYAQVPAEVTGRSSSGGARGCVVATWRRICPAWNTMAP